MRDQLLSDFLDIWPIDRLHNLSLQEYALGGNNEDSFSHWVEKTTDTLGRVSGMGGGGSFKHGIYFSETDKEYQSDKYTNDGVCAWVKKYGENRHEAFENIKQILLKVVSAAQEKDWETIDQQAFYDPVKWKWAFLYSDKVLVPIYKHEALKTGAVQLGFEGEPTYPNLYQFLIDSRGDEDAFSQSDKVWKLYERFADVNYYIIGSKYGGNADIDVFPTMYQQEVVATGFAMDLNLQPLLGKPHKEIEKYLKGKGQDKKAVHTLKYFLNIKPGDQIAVKGSGSPKGSKGFLSIIGIAEVKDTQGFYVYDPDGLGHTIKVEWLSAPIYKEFEAGGYGRTIHKLKRDLDLTKSIFQESHETVEPYWTTASLHEKQVKMNYPLNQILYGPPGTGKTYSTIDLAAKIIGFDTGSHEKNLKAFNNRMGKNIEFVTFHQSFTYEDFIEGIKPLTSDKQVTYEVQDGVFKRMAKRARKARLDIKTQEPQVKFERVLDRLKNELAASENDEVEIPLQQLSFYITDIGSEHIHFRKHSGTTGHQLKIDSLRKTFTGDIEYPDDGPGRYYNSLVRYLKEKSEDAPQTEEEITEEAHVLIIDEINRGNVAAIFGELITLIEEDKRAGGENPISITLPYSKTEFSVPSNLYLIGTMNTADRSVEALDTALRRRFSFTEEDPKPELLSPKAMIISLLNMEAYGPLEWNEEPYHSHALKLYDFLGVEKELVEAPLKKMIEELPEEEEMYWEEKHLAHLNDTDFTGIRLNQLLSTINNRIRILIDNDHTIGHAYFMGIATAPDPWAALKEVFHRNLLPLLQEYFFGDHGKIGLVLGSGFVKEDKAAERVGFANFEYPDMESLADRKLHKLVNVAEMKPEEFQQAVKNILPAKKTESDG